jgi:hypothetical protein
MRRNLKLSSSIWLLAGGFLMATIVWARSAGLRDQASRGHELDDVAIRVVNIQLLETVGPLLQGRGDPHAVEFDNLQRCRHVVDGECDVMSARNNLVSLIGPARFARLGALLGGMNLHVPELKPHAWEFERGARDFGHADEVDVEPSRCFEICANERDVVERFCIYSRSFWHV